MFVGISAGIIWVLFASITEIEGWNKGNYIFSWENK